MQLVAVILSVLFSSLMGMCVLTSVYVLFAYFRIKVITVLFMGFIFVIEFSMFLLTAASTPRRGVSLRIRLSILFLKIPQYPVLLLYYYCYIRFYGLLSTGCDYTTSLSELVSSFSCISLFSDLLLFQKYHFDSPLFCTSDRSVTCAICIENTCLFS